MLLGHKKNLHKIIYHVTFVNIFIRVQFFAMKPSQENVNFFILTISKNGHKCTEIHQKLYNAWGEDNVPCLRRIQKVSKEFCDGKR